MAPVLKGKSTGSNQKNSAKRRTPDLKNQEWGYGPRYRPTQGFNLLQISPNWFLGNWTLDPRALASHSAIKVICLFCFSGIEISQTTLPLISLMVLLECSPWVRVHRHTWFCYSCSLLVLLECPPRVRMWVQMHPGDFVLVMFRSVLVGCWENIWLSNKVINNFT